MTFRIYNTSKIRWDRDTIGRTINYWNEWITPPRNPPGSGRQTNGLGGRYLDFEEQTKKFTSPAIVIENFNANYSPQKKRLMEVAGIYETGFGAVQEKEHDIVIEVTNIQIR